VAFAGFGFRQSRAEHPIIATGILQSPGFALAEPRQRDGQSRGLFGLAAGAYYLTRVPGHTLAESGAILAAGAAGAVLASRSAVVSSSVWSLPRGWRSRVPP